MSETEIHKGKLTPISLNGVTSEERAEDACRRFLGVTEHAKYCDSWVETLQEVGAYKIITIGDVTYQVDDKDLEDYDFAEATKNADGTIDYVISFYNGGAWWGEVVEQAVNNLEE